MAFQVGRADPRGYGSDPNQEGTVVVGFSVTALKRSMKGVGVWF
jgi:hypothetical protein